MNPAGGVSRPLEILSAKNVLNWQKRRRRMSRRIEDLNPVVRQKWLGLRDDLIADGSLEMSGVVPIVVETLRTVDAQIAYFAQGRKTLAGVNALRKTAGLASIKDSENVIRTKTLDSIHLYGCAIDVWLMKNGSRLPDNHPAWDNFGVLAEAYGFVWGGRFGDDPKTKKIEGWDKCHIEYRGGLTLAELKAFFFRPRSGAEQSGRVDTCGA